MRKRTTRRAVVPQIPRGLRKKLDAAQRRDLALAHIVNLDVLARGDAEPSILHDAAGALFMWSRVAGVLGMGEPEMAEQLIVLKSVIERFKRTGRVGFSGPEYQTAKEGVEVMDALAAEVDLQTASEAAAWAEQFAAQTLGVPVLEAA